mgnify:CR=1 FL=1
MKAKFIYEKFESESDPIKDMDIGKVDFSEIYDDIIGNAEIEWDEFLGKLIHGKTITGIMIKLYDGKEGKYYARKPANYTVKVAEYKADFCTGKIRIKDERKTEYELLVDQQQYIIE